MKAGNDFDAASDGAAAPRADQDFAGCVSPFPFYYSKTNPRYVSPSSLVFVQQNMRWPYNIQANFGVQQQFTRDLAISINYVVTIVGFLVISNMVRSQAAASISRHDDRTKWRQIFLSEWTS